MEAVVGIFSWKVSGKYENHSTENSGHPARGLKGVGKQYFSKIWVYLVMLSSSFKIPLENFGRNEAPNMFVLTFVLVTTLS